MSKSDKSSDQSRKHRKQSRFSSRDDNTDDSEIDPHSPNFNPLRALYSSREILPDPQAPVYDNLAKFEAVVKNQASTSKPKPTVRFTQEYYSKKSVLNTFRFL